MQTLERSSRLPTQSAQLTLRCDAHGAPLVSATFVLERPPDPSDRLSPLVRRAVVALDLQVRLEQEATAAGPRRLIRATTLELVRQVTGVAPQVLASARVTGPFAHGAVEASLDAPAAVELLEAVVGGFAPLMATARVELAPEQQPTTRVRVDLGRLWSQLDAVADETRLFYAVDLANYAPLWRSTGIVTVEAGSDDAGAVLDGVLRAARFVLREAAVEGHPDLGGGHRLSPSSPGDQQAVASGQLTEHAGDQIACSVPVADLVAPAIAVEPQRYVHLVGAAGGRLDAVLPVRSTARTRARGGGGAPQMVFHGRVMPVSAVLNPKPPVATHLELSSQAVAAHHVAYVVPLGMVEATDDGVDRRPGPLVDDEDAAMWRDRWDRARAWYAPEFTLVQPSTTDPPDRSPFRFELETGGHTLDGSTGVTAAVTVTLQARRSAATVSAWEEAGKPELSLVPLSALSVQLAVPFRDERGQTRVERVTADRIEHDGALGQDGSRVTATFRLLDSWARLAYGALSTADFQSEPAAVVVSATLGGWRVRRHRPPIIGLSKRWALSAHRPRDGRRARPTSQALLLDSPLASATVRPAWQVQPQLVDRLERIDYEWARFAITESLTAFVSCETHGGVYRERRDGSWQAIGCRPALQLGETEYRTHVPVEVAAAAGTARVYRSLQRPGRFLVVPTSYAVGRYEPEEGERAYRPTLLLHSTIDADVPSNIRCVLAASLQPVLPPFRRAAILKELKDTAHPDPKLELPFEAGVDWEVRWAAPADVECIPTTTGFDVICTTDVAGFLSLRSMLERGGLRGSATARLPGDVPLSSALQLGLDSVTGPFESGPLELGTQRDGTIVVANRAGQRIALLGVALDGTKVADADVILEPGTTTHVELDPVVGRVDAIFEADKGSEQLEEVRAYIEDLELGVIFVATSDPADSGLAGLEIKTRFMGREDPEDLLLTTDRREAERSYTLPLTAFAADPVLEFTVTAVGADGARESGATTTWPVRTRGALVPIGPPA